MQKDSGIKFQDPDEVLHDAQLRRSADLGLWLRRFIQERRLAHQQKEADKPWYDVTLRTGSNLLAHGCFDSAGDFKNRVPPGR